MSLDYLQRLEFSVKEGWGPLCKFLDVPVPDVPFPHKKKDLNGHLKKYACQRAMKPAVHFWDSCRMCAAIRYAGPPRVSHLVRFRPKTRSPPPLNAHSVSPYIRMYIHPQGQLGGLGDDDGGDRRCRGECGGGRVLRRQEGRRHPRGRRGRRPGASMPQGGQNLDRHLREERHSVFGVLSVGEKQPRVAAAAETVGCCR